MRGIFVQNLAHHLVVVTSTEINLKSMQRVQPWFLIVGIEMHLTKRDSHSLISDTLMACLKYNGL